MRAMRDNVERLAIVCRIKAKDCDASSIAEMTGLTLEEIEEL